MDRRSFLRGLAVAPVAVAAVTARAMSAEPDPVMACGTLTAPERLPGQDYAVYFEGRIVAYATTAEVKRKHTSGNYVAWRWYRFGIPTSVPADAQIPCAHLGPMD